MTDTDVIRRLSNGELADLLVRLAREPETHEMKDWPKWKPYILAKLTEAADRLRSPGGDGELARDARRYRRLQILGCAVMTGPHFDGSHVSRFSNLDEIVDADLKAHPHRGEANPIPALSAAEATPAPVSGEAHPDDLAVDRFAAMMKEKLAKARKKGRGGWDNPDPDDGGCTIEYLVYALNEHIRKGDPVDVANFCMFLALRGASLSGATALRTPHGLPGEEELVLLMRQNLSVAVSNYGLSADIEGIEDAARAILSRLTASREDVKNG